LTLKHECSWALTWHNSKKPLHRNAVHAELHRAIPSDGPGGKLQHAIA